MKIRYVLAIAATLLFSSAAAAKDEGFYIGASVGLAAVEQNSSGFVPGDFDIDDSDYAYKLFGGYQYSPIFAVEGGYRDLGKPSSGDASTQADAFDAAAVAGVSFGPLRVFGKLGGLYWDSTTRIKGTGLSRSDDGFGLAAGAGLEFELGSMGIRGEVEYLDVLDGTWMYSIGGTFTF